MAFLTEPEFRALEIPKTTTAVTPAVAVEFLQEAKDQIERWCGETLVAAVQAKTDTAELRTRDFRKAQQIVARAKMLIWNASRPSDGGVIRTAKLLDDSSTHTTEKMSDARKEHDSLIAEAKGVLDPYLLPVEATVEDSSDFINYSATISRKAVW